MIAFDLKCSGGHVFEGWFRSSADFETQAANAMIPCPMCGDGAVAKAVMAPNVARKGNRVPALAAPTPSVAPALPATAPLMSATTLPAPIAAMAAALAAAQAEALPRSTWVGDQFAARARAMHDGDEDHALIHGQATRAEAEALVDDGVAILPLLVPVIPPELQN
jgi:hypothetical protein